MNNRERYMKSFSVLKASPAPEWIYEEECTMKEKKPLRMNKKLLVLCVVLVAVFAVNIVTYAATGNSLVGQIRVWLNGKEQDVPAVYDEDGNVYVDIEDEFDENGDAQFIIDGEGYSMEFDLNN